MNAFATGCGLSHIPTRAYAHRGLLVAATRPRSERTARLRAAQRSWLEAVIDRSGVTATQIARTGRLNPSTLTRFLQDEERATVLSTATIAAVAEATGEQPPADLLALDAPPLPPVARRETEAEVWRDGPGATPIRAMIAGDPNLSAWTIGSDLLTLAGVRRGDVVVIDQRVVPRDGDVVCAQVENGYGAQTMFRLWRPPMLIAAAADPMAARPELVDNERVRIAGVVVGLFRVRS